MILAIDTENTTWNKGSPFDERNFNVCISTYDGSRASTFWPSERGEFEHLFNQTNLVIGFNLKYDLHWLRRIGIVLKKQRLWCCQVGEFTLGRQQSPYPSLAQCADLYGLPGKLTVVEDEYWSKGVNTHEVPVNILEQYAKQDALLTYQVYQKQQERIQPHQHKLLSLLMQDLVTLQDMEWNGLFFDEKKSLEKAKETETEISEIQAKLSLYHTVPCFNWSSNHHLSALLYGGQIKETIRTQIGEYKSGPKRGQPRYKKSEFIHRLPRMYKPIRGSVKQGDSVWSVEESYLRRLGSSDIIDGILRIKELEKLRTTYYEGLPNLRYKMNYEPNILHTQFNQVVTKTGRLSSSKPNLQNLSPSVEEIFRSRYA